MTWKSLRLELGDTEEFPSGSVGRVYLIRLPLDDDDKVDAVAFDNAPHRATCRRHWSSEPDETGRVIHRNGEWMMMSDGRLRTIQFGSRSVRLGEQIKIQDEGGAILPFRIASIR
jgi:hypothetical protein